MEELHSCNFVRACCWWIKVAFFIADSEDFYYFQCKVNLVIQSVQTSFFKGYIILKLINVRWRIGLSDFFASFEMLHFIMFQTCLGALQDRFSYTKGWVMLDFKVDASQQSVSLLHIDSYKTHSTKIQIKLSKVKDTPKYAFAARKAATTKVFNYSKIRNMMKIFWTEPWESTSGCNCLPIFLYIKQLLWWMGKTDRNMHRLFNDLRLWTFFFLHLLDMTCFDSMALWIYNEKLFSYLRYG